MKCPECQKKVDNKHCFCPYCGFMIHKPSVSIPTTYPHRVEKAFDKMGLNNSRRVRELGYNSPEEAKSKILGELYGGVKFRDQVVRGENVGRMSKL